ncbi:MAG: enoyl-CoA hydratase-related protein, partial [Bdellovibrionota bacterium]
MAEAAAISPTPSYPTFKVVRVEREGHVGYLTLSNPAKLNAMGPDFWNEFPQAIKALESDPEVRCIVVKADGRGFTAGLDLMSMGGTLQGGGASSGGNTNPATSVAGRKRFFDEVKRLQDSISSADACVKPTIAAIHGACIGGGVDLSTACDIRLATKDAKFSIRETRIAMVADVGTLQRLPRILGRGLAAELAYTGRDF